MGRGLSFLNSPKKGGSDFYYKKGLVETPLGTQPALGTQPHYDAPRYFWVET